MRYAHTITISAFAKPEDDAAAIRDGLVSLFPFSLPEEEILLEEQHATGFNDRKIAIFAVTLSKESHITSFLKHMLEKLGEEQRHLLLDQLESRLDAEHAFFLRLDKQAVLKHKRWLLTESGDCYHIRMAVAAYPKTREASAAVVRRIIAEL